MENHRVKHQAFHPAPDGKLSVFEISGLASHQKWELGNTHVGSDVKASAEMADKAFRAAGLKIDFNNTPPRHADICDWPTDKAEMKTVAMDLAAQASLDVL